MALQGRAVSLLARRGRTGCTISIFVGRRGTGGQWHDAIARKPELYAPTSDDWPHRLLCLIVLLPNLRAEHACRSLLYTRPGPGWEYS